MKLKIQNPFYRFIILSIFCYLIWFVLYDLWLKENGIVDDLLGESTTWIVVKIMHILDYHASYKESYRLFFFYNDGVKLLQMVPACNGQVLHALFIGFIIAAPGIVRNKLKFVLCGIVAIFIINCFRVLALCLLKIHAPDYLAFNHKYTFTVLVYGCIFGMWAIWIQYFVPKAIKSDKVD